MGVGMGLSVVYNYIKCLVSYNGLYEFVNVNSLSFVNINRSNNKPVRYKISYHVMSFRKN